MSAKVDQFCDRLRDRLNAIEGWLESVKTHIQSLSGTVRDDLRNKWEQAHTKLHAQKERVEQTRADLKSQPQLVADVLETIFGWEAKSDVRELHAEPAPTEAHAEAAIDRAVAGIDEVGDAALYAAAARLHSTV